MSWALVVALSAVLGQAPSDPAGDPPPPMTPEVEGQVVEEPAPRPLEVPPQVQEPVPPTPHDIEPRPDTGERPADPPAETEANPGWILLAVDYVIIFIPLLNTPLIVPLVQGIAHMALGESLAKNTYPYWWVGTLAGYATYVVAGGAFVGGYVLIFVGALSGAATQNVPLTIGAIVGGLALMAGGLVITFLEPLVVYFAASIGAKPARANAARAVGDVRAPFELVTDAE